MQERKEWAVRFSRRNRAFVYKKVRTKMGGKQESKDFEAISVAKMMVQASS